MGSKDKYLAIGQEDISCLQGVEQDWKINVESGEVVKLTFTTDSSSNGANQTGQFKITVRNASSGIVIYMGATTTILVDTADNSDRWRQQYGRNVDSGTGRSRRSYLPDEKLRQRPVLLH